MGLIISLLSGTGISIAGESPACEPVPNQDQVPWPGLAPWVESSPWPGPVPWEEPSPWPGPLPPSGYIEVIEKTLDETHAILERNILKQTVRFDSIFGTVTPESLRHTSYYLRWRNSVRLERGTDYNFGTNLQANFSLPRISERLRLYFSGEDEPGLTTQSLPEDPGNPGFDRTTPTTHFANTELRYELIRKPSLNLFLGTGVRLSLPFEVFARSRLQYLHDFGDNSLMRVAETFFVKNSDFIGETTEISLERLVGGSTLLRWASAGTASQEIEGIEWGSELSLFRQISAKDAITLKGGVYGNSASAGLVQNRLLLARFRRNFLRSWLFYELEPQITWPRNRDGNNPAILAFTVRIEIVFQGTTTR